MADDISESHLCDDLEGVEINPEHILKQQSILLEEACFIGDLAKVKELLNGLPDAEARDLLIRAKSLPTAAVSGDLDLLRYLASHPLVNLEDETDLDDDGPVFTPLMNACTTGNYLSAKTLLECGADPNHGFHYFSPLMLACWNGSTDLVSVLLECGADPTRHPITNTQEETSLPFYVACHMANLDIVEILLNYFSDDGNSSISREQVILCRSVIGLQLIFSRQDLAAGTSFWKSALEEFAQLTKQTRGFIHQYELSRMLHQLYLRESYLVQTGKSLQLKGDLLPRTRARFPDFTLCARSEDVNTVFDVTSETAQLASLILPITSCVMEVGCVHRHVHHNDVRDHLVKIGDTRMTKENTRLCLLVFLENMLSLRQESHIVHSEVLDKVSSLVLERRLFEHNAGYLMLILDVINCALDEVQSQTVRGDRLSCEVCSGDTTHVTGRQLNRTAELFALFTYLILHEDLNENETSHLSKLFTRYIALTKKVECGSSMVEFSLLMTTVNFLVDKRDDFRGIQDPEDWFRPGIRLLQSLLRCGVDPNSRDEDGNTVMVLAVGLSEPLRCDVIELLMAYGGHVDITNFAGTSPFQILLTLPDCRLDPFRCRTLKCRAASTVTFFKIPYAQRVPKHIADFIALHEMHTPKRVADINRIICGF